MEWIIQRAQDTAGDAERLWKDHVHHQKELYQEQLGAGPSGTASSGAAASSVPPMSRNISIEDLPPEYRPIGMWGYFGYNLLFSIPFVGWIIALVFACGVTSNVNLKNYARGYFCGLIVACVVVFLFSVSGCSILSAMM